jgi:hypothetical protein
MLDAKLMKNVVLYEKLFVKIEGQLKNVALGLPYKILFYSNTYCINGQKATEANNGSDHCLMRIFWKILTEQQKKNK